jgi:hypothetical protein
MISLNKILAFAIIILIAATVFAVMDAEKFEIKRSEYLKEQEGQLANYKAAAIKTESGWGYHILYGEKKIIEQKHIPAINGVASFNSEEDALKVANLAIDKIKKGVFPPTITVAELDSLKVIN